MKKQQTHYQKTLIGGVNIFHREAGDPTKPTILLLGGFPSTSAVFDRLIDDLSSDFHLLAPDYPGFGFSDTPSAKEYEYTFHNLSITMEQWIDQIGLRQFTLYAFDYGAPIGFRIASRRPELIKALIVQNGNAYAEGIGPAFGAAMPFLQNRNAETEVPIRGLMQPEGIAYFYHTGASDINAINPNSIALDYHFLSRPGLVDIHLDLLHNYSSNLGEFDKWQKYFRTHQPPTLLAWGAGDPFFPIEAANAFKKDLPNAELHQYPTSHFALEEFHTEIADNIRSFFTKNQLN